MAGGGGAGEGFQARNDKRCVLETLLPHGGWLDGGKQEDPCQGVGRMSIPGANRFGLAQCHRIL